jgi:pyruvate/2-oxoglutarate/acetoin dehydrogenase E1 component
VDDAIQLSDHCAPLLNRLAGQTGMRMVVAIIAGWQTRQAVHGQAPFALFSSIGTAC